MLLLVFTRIQFRSMCNMSLVLCNSLFTVEIDSTMDITLKFQELLAPLFMLGKHLVSIVMLKLN